MKNILIEMKKTFSGLISKLNTREERINELKAMSKGIIQTETQSDNKVQTTNQNRDSKDCGTLSNIRGIRTSEGKLRAEEILEELMVNNFPKLIKEATDPRSSENAKQHK